MCHKWFVQAKNVQQAIEASGGTEMDVEKMLGNTIFTQKVGKIFCQKVQLYRKFNYRVEYRQGVFIATKDNDSEFPIFQEIVTLLVASDTPFAVCKIYKTVEYNELYLGYKIQEKIPYKNRIINLKELSHILVYERHQPYHSSGYYIISRYKII